MPPSDKLPNTFDLETVKALEDAFEDVWSVLNAHLPPESDAAKELGLTLSRTLLTGVTTLGPMAALYFFGGPAMKDLSLPIIIGVLVGTYSSIYIASPIVLWWSKWTGTSLRRQVLDSGNSGSAKPSAA